MFRLSHFESGIIEYDQSALEYLSKLDKSVKVIAIMGEARLGKSTLLNCIISHLLGENINAFETSDNIEHCTTGINMYHCKDHLFLDCQGIQYHDSSNDVKIMLLPYLISNVIIFNTHMINNSTLKTLEPLILFCNYINADEIKKPRLIFRIRDLGLECDVRSILEQTLQKRDDHYESIRETIRLLFSDISVSYSNVLSRKKLALLKNNKYISIINDSTHFQGLIDHILQQSIEVTTLNNDFVERLKFIKNHLNNNRKITCKDLDTLTLITENHLNDFIMKIDRSNYQFFMPDGTQKYYTDTIEPRIHSYHNIIHKYNDSFTKINPKLKQKYQNIISDKIKSIIDKAIIYNEKFAVDKMNVICKKILERYTIVINKSFSKTTFDNNNKKFSSVLADINQDFVIRTKHIYDKAKHKYG